MKELLTKISLTTLILTYLFFCGTLYLISYWSTFDFDITNYIELLDIPKSFVYPLATGVGLGFLIYFFQLLKLTEKKIEKDKKIDEELLPRIEELSTKTILKRTVVNVELWIWVVLIVLVFFYKPGRTWVIGLFGVLLIFYAILKFVSDKTIIGLIPQYVYRLILGFIIFFIPIFSFIKGKSNAVAVWKNHDYFVIQNVIFKDASITNPYLISKKLLGKLGNNVFLSDSLTTNIIVLNLEQVQSIEYKHIQKK